MELYLYSYWFHMNWQQKKKKKKIMSSNVMNVK